MTKEENIFNQIREKFRQTGEIDTFDMQKLEEALQTVKLQTQDDYEFIDDVTDFLIEQGNKLAKGFFEKGNEDEGRSAEKPYYQSAYNILNSCSKRFNSKYHYIFAIKTYYVRTEALKENLDINLKRMGTSLDSLEVLKTNYGFIKSELEMIKKEKDEDMIFRAEWLIKEIDKGIKLLEQRNAMKEGKPDEIDEMEHTDDSGKGDTLVGDTVVNDAVVAGTVVEGEPIIVEPVTEEGKNGDGDMAKKRGKAAGELSLESIAEQLEALDGELVNPLNDSYTHLQILLKIIALQYNKIRVLDRKIAEKTEELDKLQIIFGDELSVAGLELLNNGASLTQRRQTISSELTTMTEDRLNVLASFEENKKSAEKAIEDLDRGE